MILGKLVNQLQRVFNKPEAYRASWKSWKGFWISSACIPRCPLMAANPSAWAASACRDLCPWAAPKYIRNPEIKVIFNYLRIKNDRKRDRRLFSVSVWSSFGEFTGLVHRVAWYLTFPLSIKAWSLFKIAYIVFNWIWKQSGSYYRSP